MELTVIAKLKGIQSREGLTDKEMAKLLGCSRQTYQGTRTGKLSPGKKIITGISATFPELKEDVHIFLSSNANKCSSDATKTPLSEGSEPQSKLLRFCVGLIGKIRERLFS